jgi:hypothetical protein
MMLTFSLLVSQIAADLRCTIEQAQDLVKDTPPSGRILLQHLCCDRTENLTMFRAYGIRTVSAISRGQEAVGLFTTPDSVLAEIRSMATGQLELAMHPKMPPVLRQMLCYFVEGGRHHNFGKLTVWTTIALGQM